MAYLVTMHADVIVSSVGSLFLCPVDSQHMKYVYHEYCHFIFSVFLFSLIPEKPEQWEVPNREKKNTVIVIHSCRLFNFGVFCRREASWNGRKRKTRDNDGFDMVPTISVLTNITICSPSIYLYRAESMQIFWTCVSAARALTRSFARFECCRSLSQWIDWV